MGVHEEIWAGQSLNVAVQMMLATRTDGLAYILEKGKDPKALDEFLGQTFDLAKKVFEKGKSVGFLNWGKI
jgi:hypothetical protein